MASINTIFENSHNFTNIQKKAHVNWYKEILKKQDPDATKAICNNYRSGSVHMSPKKQHFTVWVFQDEPNPTKVVRWSNLLKQIVACFFSVTGHSDVTTI